MALCLWYDFIPGLGDSFEPRSERQGRSISVLVAMLPSIETAFLRPVD
jgi:hypothetical protein